VGIREIDGRKVGTGKTGPITKKICQTYFAWLESGRDGMKYI
jgi:branched-subunit amino acid aminotransferase/4-amino-4-deoxychorismate lyase